MAASSSASSSIRTWRTAFLTLRDETLTSSPNTESKSLPHLLHTLIFSNSHSLLAAAPDLPPHEVTSDLLFLMELAASCTQHEQDLVPVFSHISSLLHDVCRLQRVSLQMNSSSWSGLLNSFATMLQFLIGKAGGRPPFSSNAAGIRPAIECLETLRYFVSVHHQKFLSSDDIQLVKFLVDITESSHGQLCCSRSTAAIAKRLTKYSSLWEVQTIAFGMLGESFARVGSSVPDGIWQSTIEVLRKVIDFLASKNLIVEDIVMSRFYASMLNCLHLVLEAPRGSLLDHVPGFVAALRLFFTYGLTSRTQCTYMAGGHMEKEPSFMSAKLGSEEPMKRDHLPYRPPHLRKKDNLNMRQPRAQDALSFPHHESSSNDFTSSDSDCSDSDGSGRDAASIQSSKVRVAAIACVQDLCQADRKSFTTQWTMLLPTNDVLQQRKSEATLMTCLLFDPNSKARIASASALAAMLGGPSSVFLQVAEYKESNKWGSFMALSSSLGGILMQLHIGILYLIERESHIRLLSSLFKTLTLLISSTPYSRMPVDLLPRVLTSVLARIENGFPSKSDQTGLLATAINCLIAALSTSPSSPQVKQMLLEEISEGIFEVKKRSGVLYELFQYSEQLRSPALCFEALQALRALTHNYPSITIACWEQVFALVSKILRAATPEVSTRMWNGPLGDSVGEKVITGAVKVLDECLRATSGFKGIEDLVDDNILETPFTSDWIKTTKVASAPSYEPESSEEEFRECQSGNELWSRAIEHHMPLLLCHSSSMVRAASVTCFAGITSSVFFSLGLEKQDFIITSLVNGAIKDEVPSVRSAACRAIGVVSCFPKVSERAEILERFINAVETNTRHPLISVRTTASWALAHLCECLQYCADALDSKNFSDANGNSQLMAFLTECALHLTKDGDKIKTNAVRTLGHLSRIMKFTSSDVHDNSVDSLQSSRKNVWSTTLHCGHGKTLNSCQPTSLEDPPLVDRIIQAFLSCVTTGNCKVQWNVCHALSYLFLNETLRLQDKDWAPSVFSVLLLLLRDSGNFKVRIQAAAALAVPATLFDYGKSFSDVVQGLEHILESMGSDQIQAPSSFKYRVALEKQITSTMLHALSLVSGTDNQSLKDFLVKKAPFLEEWFKALCSSVGDTSRLEAGNFTGNQKKEMISKALHSLIEVYASRNQQAIVQKFEKLDDSLK